MLKTQICVTRPQCVKRKVRLRLRRYKRVPTACTYRIGQLFKNVCKVLLCECGGYYFVFDFRKHCESRSRKIQVEGVREQCAVEEYRDIRGGK